MLVAKIAIAIQFALYCQPDAKVANGIYWAEFWWHLARRILS